ncbi:MAG TPA: glycosyltransferase family 4 protein [Clostridia bacterium]|nr:glycosyltransferase family 4 protein [Clostridia bacterium]
MREKGILFITNLELWSITKGGGATSLATTINFYLDNGYAVYVITGNKVNWDQLKGKEGILIKEFDCPWFKKLFRLKKIGFLAKALWWLWFQVAAFWLAVPLLRKKKIYWVYGYELMGVPVAYLLAKLFKLKSVSRFQGSTLGFFIGRPLWQVRAWDHILALKTPTDLMIMTNDGQREDQVLAKIKAKPKRFCFWQNGVNKDMFIPNFNREEFLTRLGISPDKFVILTVSRLHKWKRVDRIINALPEIVKQCRQVQLLVVGDGELRTSLEALVDRLKIREYVKFAGSVPQVEVKEYLNAADLFVSLYDSSNVGNPLLEAMSCGKCILTLNNGTTGQIIKNYENGILLEMDQLKDLPKYVLELINNKDLREKLGKAAKEYAEKNFWTWEERMQAEINQLNLLLKE